MESILNSVKKALGISSDFTAFDSELIMHINSVFSTLTQLGVGPAEGYSITDAFDNWSDFIDSDNRLLFIKTYMYIKVRLVFDPPVNSFTITALEKQAQELEWRINVAKENSDMEVL